MLPTYDHNGNVARLIRAENSTVVAAYEYAPFGEPRALQGVYSQRNPFRWSTKYTDAETGLVYYG